MQQKIEKKKKLWYNKIKKNIRGKIH